MSTNDQNSTTSRKTNKKKKNSAQRKRKRIEFRVQRYIQKIREDMNTNVQDSTTSRKASKFTEQRNILQILKARRINDQNSKIIRRAEREMKKKIYATRKRKRNKRIKACKEDEEITCTARNFWQTSKFDKNVSSFSILESLQVKSEKIHECPLKIEGWGEIKNPVLQEPHDDVCSFNAKPDPSLHENTENVKTDRHKEISCSSLHVPQMLASDLEIDLICSDLLCLHGKKIVLLLNYDSKRNFLSFIEESIKFSGFAKMWCTGKGICKSLWESSLMIEWKENDTATISMAYGRTESEACKYAIEYILGFLLEYCFTISVTKTICTAEIIQLESLLSSKPDKKRNKSPCASNFVNKNLQTILNVNSIFLHNVNSLLGDMNRRVLNNEPVSDLEFSLDLTLEQTCNIRRIVDEKYNETLKGTYQYNKYLCGENLVISAKWDHISLLQHLLRNRGSTKNYKLYYPNCLSMTNLLKLMSFD